MMNKMDRYTIVEGAGRHIHDSESHCIIAHAISPEDAAHICAALNVVEHLQRDGAIKFRGDPVMPDMRRAEWANYAGAALPTMATSPNGTMDSDTQAAGKYADAMMAEADRRFSHE